MTCITKCENEMKNPNRLQHREKQFTFKSLGYIHQCTHNHFDTPSLMIHCRHKTLTQPCSFLCRNHSNWCGAPDSNQNTQATCTSWLCLTRDILLWVTRMLVADGAGATADYTAQRHEEEWHSWAVLASIVCNIIRSHANGRTLSECVFDKQISASKQSYGAAKCDVLWTGLACFFVHKKLCHFCERDNLTCCGEVHNIERLSMESYLNSELLWAPSSMSAMEKIRSRFWNCSNWRKQKSCFK
jgi:hypothetical protein